jgi:putative endonuclease
MGPGSAAHRYALRCVRGTSVHSSGSGAIHLGMLRKWMGCSLCTFSRVNEMGRCNVGVTNNLARRVAEHKAKLVPGFTREYGVDQLVYFETFDSILEARAREHSLKRWRRAWKIELIEKLNPDWRDLSGELNS